jgi:hypothetical protein
MPLHPEEDLLRGVFRGSGVAEQAQTMSENSASVRGIELLEVAFYSWADVASALPAGARHGIRPKMNRF